MKPWIRCSLSLSLVTLFVSACALVEDFQGYEPIGGSCDKPPCDEVTSSSSSTGSSTGGSAGVGGTGAGGMGSGGTGGSGSSTGGGGGAGGGTDRCAKIACNSEPCAPEVVVPDSQSWLMDVDTESFYIRTNAQDHILRLAKPGCLISPFDQQIGTSFPDQGFVSDGRYAAWLKLDIAGTCFAPALTFCDPTLCKPQDIPLPAAWADQGSFARLTLGPDHLYFTMRNGLVGRVAKNATNPELLWIDPANQPATMKRGYLKYPVVSDGKLMVVREFIEDAGMSVCVGTSTGYSGAILVSDMTADTAPQVVAPDLNFPGAVALSQNYVYFVVYDFAALLHRVPKAGGAVEKLAVNAMLSSSNSLSMVRVHKGWVYFRVGLPNDMQGIGRLPAETTTFTPDAVEIVAQSINLRAFFIDDDALYWDDCLDAGCTSSRVLARVMTP